MLEQLLLITIILLTIHLFRLGRRLETSQRAYLFVVLAILVVCTGAWVEASRFWGVVGVSMAVLTVAFPWVLEGLARLAFSRSRLALAVRLAGWRAVLMPGGGLSRQHSILRGLAVLEKGGVDQALAHLRRLAAETEDDGELAAIYEQIVSMLFYGQRWAEAIELYESKFHSQYAALRPALALGLLRAYGESNDMQAAATLLRALESGPVGSDPRARGVVSQAQLTFLAYAGDSRVSQALTKEHRRVLGISDASGAFMRGIALARSGKPQRAYQELERVRQLARRTDDRVVQASRSALAKLEGFGESAHPVELEPEIRRYADGVSERLSAFLALAPTLRRAAALVATPLLAASLLAGVFALRWLDRGGVGLLELGAVTPGLVRAGSWGRLFVAPFLQSDLVGALLSVYAVWLAGPFVERLHGRLRTIVIGWGGAVVGLGAAAWLTSNTQAVLGGGSLVAIGIIVAALWTLRPQSTPSVPSRTRRGLLISLSLLAAAQLMSLMPGVFNLDLTPIGVVASSLVAVAVLSLPARRWVHAAMAGTCVVLFAGAVVGGVMLAREDADSMRAESLESVTLAQRVRLQLPASFVRATDSVPMARLRLRNSESIIDSLGLRVGEAARFAVVAAADEHPVLFAAEPTLRHDLQAVEIAVPQRFADAYEAAGGRANDLAAYDLRSNGEPIGRLVERRLGESYVVFVATPPVAFERSIGLHAAALASATEVGAADASAPAVRAGSAR